MGTLPFVLLGHHRRLAWVLSTSLIALSSLQLLLDGLKNRVMAGCNNVVEIYVAVMV